jgi:hypothetical protein
MPQSKPEALINQYIANYPQLAIKFLKSERIAIANDASLDEITEALYKAYYKGDKAFAVRLGKYISEGEHVGVVIIDDIIIAVVVTGIAAARAKSKFELEKRIAENKAQVAKNAALKKTEAEIAAERARIVASSAEQYKEDLQEQSTARRKNAIIFVAGIAVLGIVAALIFKKK